MAKPKFPILATILLVTGVAWVAEALGYLNTEFPWFPVVLIIVAIGMITNRYLGH